MKSQTGPHVAIIGAGMAGSACAQGLLEAGWTVCVFEKSRGAGGRMATRRAHWEDAPGQAHSGVFDHGAPGFQADDPRFLGAIERARSQGLVTRWEDAQAWLSAPEQPSWTRQMLQGAELRAQHTVTALHRSDGAWWIQVAEREAAAPLGPFDAVALAIPAIQAAALLDAVHPAWAQAARAVPQQPIWTLMAARQTPPSPGDVAPTPTILKPGDGPLALVVRQDLKPTRGGPPAWVAHATLAWTLEHLEHPAEAVKAELLHALEAALTSTATVSASVAPAPAPTWAHTTVHRWRYGLVGPSNRVAAPEEEWSTLPCLWDPSLALGLAGDAFAGARRRETGVQRAWLSGTELAGWMRRHFQDFSANTRHPD